MTSQSQLVCDSSNFTNFSAWASPISAWFGTCGWVQANDTGQVVWTATVLTLTQATVSGGNAVYAYSSFTGPAPRVGMSIIVTGFTNGGNNVTATLTVVSGGSSGNVTVVNGTAVNETHSGSATTTVSSVPGSGAYIYEVWKPGDALTAYYVKIEYGNSSGTNAPALRLTLSTTTNGAGTATGQILGPTRTAIAAVTPPSTTTQYECNFTGDTGRIAVMMWRNTGTNSVPQFFSIERSVNSSGTWTSTYATLWAAGCNSVGSPNANVTQQSLVLASGAATVLGGAGLNGSWNTRCPISAASQSLAFGNSIPFETAAPLVGYSDYPCTSVGTGAAADFAEGVTFQITLYGSTRTYLPSKVFPFNQAGPITTSGTNLFALCMRFD